MSIEWSPQKYDAADVVGREAGSDMLSRLALISLKPKTILDVGCGIGHFSKALKKQFPDAQVIALDSSTEMIAHASSQISNLSCVASDAVTLPFKDHSIDLVFANFFVPWCDNFRALLKTWRRILHPNGMLMLNALGLDTLQTLPANIHPRLVDMHDLGDCLVKEGFAEPVLDVSYFDVAYRSNQKMCEELHASGMVAQLLPYINMQTVEDKWHLNYEVIYAHAFVASGAREQGTTHIPLAEIKKQLK